MTQCFLVPAEAIVRNSAWDRTADVGPQHAHLRNRKLLDCGAHICGFVTGGGLPLYTLPSEGGTGSIGRGSAHGEVCASKRRHVQTWGPLFRGRSSGRLVLSLRRRIL